MPPILGSIDSMVARKLSWVSASMYGCRPSLRYRREVYSSLSVSVLVDIGYSFLKVERNRSNTSSHLTIRPSCRLSEVGFAPSTLKLSWRTLIPTPIIERLSSHPNRLCSMRIPEIFCPLTSISFGHFISTPSTP